MAWNEPGPGRDPWNQGPKRSGGSPDLDEMLRRLKARFKSAGPGAPGPRASNLLWMVAIAIGLLWVASGLYVVDAQERAVVLRFGNFTGTTEPGLQWHWPWPIESQETINVTGVRSTKDQAVMLTKDTNIIDVELSVQYRISDVGAYVFNVKDPDTTLRELTKAAVREVVGHREMDAILTKDRQGVGDDTKKILQERLDAYQTGLVVTEVNLQQAQPPEPVQAAFADAIKAAEDQQRLQNEAEAYSNDRIPRAKGGAARQLAEATAYRDQTIARAQGDASRFSQLLAEYRKAPEVTRKRLYLDSMNGVLNNSSKILIDVDKGNPMLYLPLQELMKRAQGAEGSPDYGNAPGSSNTAPRGGSADSSRSRDRGRP